MIIIHFDSQICPLSCCLEPQHCTWLIRQSTTVAQVPASKTQPLHPSPISIFLLSFQFHLHFLFLYRLYFFHTKSLSTSFFVFLPLYIWVFLTSLFYIFIPCQCLFFPLSSVSVQSSPFCGTSDHQQCSYRPRPMSVCVCMCVNIIAKNLFKTKYQLFWHLTDTQTCTHIHKPIAFHQKAHFLIANWIGFSIQSSQYVCAPDRGIMTLMSNRGSLLLSGFPPFHFLPFSCSLNLYQLLPILPCHYSSSEH